MEFLIHYSTLESSVYIRYFGFFFKSEMRSLLQKQRGNCQNKTFFKQEIRQYIPDYRPNNGCQGIVNQAYTSLNGGLSKLQ